MWGVTAASAKKPRPPFSGAWMWKGPASKDREQIGLFLDLVQKGNRITGTYSVGLWINGESQAEDGNQTPLEGTVKGDVATLRRGAGASLRWVARK